MVDEFYSNCFIEMVKAKLRNPAVKVMFLPAFLNECSCPHWMWLDEEGEHDFHFKGQLPWWKWIWHRGYIRTVHRGCYKGCIDQMIEKKYYSKKSQITANKRTEVRTMPEFRRLTYKTPDGAWGIKGVSLLTCPARLYGAAAKLCDMESLCEDVYRAKDAELTLDALQELVDKGLGGRFLDLRKALEGVDL